jgi:hypothetical protein
MLPMSNDLFLLGTEFRLRNNCRQGSVPSANYVQGCKDVQCSEDAVFGINLSDLFSSNLKFSFLSFKKLYNYRGKQTCRYCSVQTDGQCLIFKNRYKVVHQMQ